MLILDNVHGRVLRRLYLGQHLFVQFMLSWGWSANICCYDAHSARQDYWRQREPMMSKLLVCCRDGFLTTHESIIWRIIRLCLGHKLLPSLMLAQNRASWIIQLQKSPVLVPDIRKIAVQISAVNKFDCIVANHFFEGAAQIFLRIV